MSRALWFAALMSCAPCLAQSVAFTAADFGPTDADPLVVAGAWTCAPGAVFDCGPRRIVFAPGAIIQASTASVTASEITVAGGAVVIGVDLTFTASASGGTSGDVVVRGELSVAGAAPGRSLTVVAAGGIRILDSGRCTAAGTANGAPGGIVVLTAGTDLVVAGGPVSVDVSGGPLGVAGSAALLAPTGDVSCSTAIVGDGDAGGGSVFILAGDDLALADVRLLGGVAPGSYFGGAGGSLSVSALGDLALSGVIDVSTAQLPTPAIAAAGSVQLSSGAALVSSGTIRADGGAFGPAGLISADAGGDFTLSVGAHWSASTEGEDGFGGSFDVSAGGGLYWLGAGTASAGASLFAAGGVATLTADDDAVLAGTLVLHGTSPGAAEVRSMACSVSVPGTVDVSSFVVDGLGGSILLMAEEDVVVSGVLDASGLTDHTGAGMIDVMAGHRVHVTSGGDVRLGGHDAGHLMLDGCRVDVDPGAVVYADGDHHGGHLEVRCGDAAHIDGSWTAHPLGHIDIATRLPAPYSVVAVPLSAAHAVMIMHDPSSPPCLARGRAAFTPVADVVAPGAEVALTLSSTPGSAIVVLLALDPGFVSLDAFGFTQIDPALSVRLADAGVYGAPLAGSSLDAAGVWSFSAFLPPSPALAGFSLRFEAVVLDDTARNGLFHQPPAVVASVQ